MTEPMLPASALRLAASTGATAVLVGSRRSRVVHLHSFTSRRQAPTTAGTLRRGDTPVCGRSSRRWRVVSLTGRPLCRSCAAWVDRQRLGVYPTPSDFLKTIEAATNRAELESAGYAACIAGMASQRVTTSDGATETLTRLVGMHRSRVEMGPEQEAAWRRWSRLGATA